MPALDHPTVRQLRDEVRDHTGPIKVYPSANAEWLVPPVRVYKNDLLAYLDQVIAEDGGGFPAPFGIAESSHRGPMILDYP